MKVSVILPVYNGEKTLSKTLNSLLNQSFQDFELIICIDGSNDNSLQIIEDYQNKFKQIVILENPKNIGLGPTMNRLVSHTTTEYIAVAEQDDLYYPERLSLQIKVLDTNPSVGLVSGIADFWDGEKISMQFPAILVSGRQYPKGKEIFLLNYKYQTKVVNSCMMFRKSVHTANGLYFSKHYPNVSVDWCYFLRFCWHSDIYGISKSLVLLDRRENRNSITSNKSKQYAASRELIRSFYYEYPNIITSKDYKFAMTTQHLMQLSMFTIYHLPLMFVWYLLQNPNDSRWLPYIKRRLKIK